jgi:alpha-mannosidase
VIHDTRWTAQKIEQRLKLIMPLVYRRQHPIAPFRYQRLSSPLDQPPVETEIDDRDWDIIESNTYWGEWHTNFVLRSSFQVPVDWHMNERVKAIGTGKQAVGVGAALTFSPTALTFPPKTTYSPPTAPIALYLPLGIAGDFIHPEVLVYVDGKAYAASDRYHHEIRLKPEWFDGRTHTLALHGWTGTGEDHGKPNGHRLLMEQCSILQIDQPTRAFITTVEVALGTIKVLDEQNPIRGKLLNALDDAFKQLDTREPFGEEFYASIPAAHALLREGIAQAGPPLDVCVTGTGHAHIDVAWLWTLGQTRRKAGRTFHTVEHLMDQFPEYHFTQSQPQLYDYVRQDYPELFEKIKQRVAEGRWEAIGGMWVEADCNLTGPESLARQFLLGRSFFTKHFGPKAESPVLWLPDVFGYAWALPQLIKQAGLEYFFTIKIGWSQYNRLPFDSFWWQGLDGTRILTHFSTTPHAPSPLHTSTMSTYNSMATPEELMGTWTNAQQKDLGRGRLTPPFLMAFGHGDGGGGPTREMQETIREMREFPGLPRIRQRSVKEFFQELDTTAGDILPTWNGELYLEYHRGTYTTQSRNKRANRQSEFRLHDAEALASFALLLDPGYRYPAKELRRAWELVCLNQFHDIIPGSSITDVYTESQQQYAEICHIATKARDQALQAIATHSKGDVLVVNPTSFARNEPAFWIGRLPINMMLVNGQTGKPVYTQATATGTWISTGTINQFSVNPFKLIAGSTPKPVTDLVATTDVLENAYIRIELNPSGDITRIYDKQAQREVLPLGAIANQFEAFEDRPMNWDAWDIDIFYDDKMWTADPATSIRLVEAGPLHATLEIKRRILHSSYVQRISLSYNSPRLDIETKINWTERHILLKVAFPVDILAPQATYEIQWGNVQRPTHRNTSWDWARFETCAHKWVDLSEGGYGVSLLNDCKYGHDIHDNVMRLSLLRSPTYPDPTADQGEQTFTYSLLPHDGNWDERTIGAAYALNDPLIVHTVEKQRSFTAGTSKSAEQAISLINVANPNIVIETIKRAEDGNGIIVRLYESQRNRGPVTLTTGFPVREAWHTNLLEENDVALAVTGREVTFDVRPYEIVTLRLVP